MDILEIASEGQTGRLEAPSVGSREQLGQFMTPESVAAFMAGLFAELPDTVHLLDAGAGRGSLTAAFVRQACSRAMPPKAIKATAFEVDPALIPELRSTMDSCVSLCAAAGIAFEGDVIHDDYVLHAAEGLISGHALAGAFDCAILNPPYAKINSASRWRHALRRMGIETSNLYTAFVAVALSHLREGGQMVAITPRSFCNGTYFEPFRRHLLGEAALERIHLYGSRRKAFAEDAVLQENIVFKLTKGVPAPDQVQLSTSDGPGAEVTTRAVPFSEVVSRDDRHAFIRLPVTAEHSALAEKVRALPCSLADLGIRISTGRVVDFRARDHLRQRPGSDTVPLIYPAHFSGGGIAWPKPEGRKPNALASNAATSDLMVPSGTYVLTKRFTSKEEKRRLVAVVYDPALVADGPVGFENHLNYFHENGRGLPCALALGLAIFLNSTAVDEFFRQFSGHTQVNATDIRNMHFPTRAALEDLGALAASGWPDQAKIDAAVGDLV